MLITILATIVVLGVLIFVHELGHFLTAKLVDIEVPRFSIGLGPKAWGFKRGETEYVISWLPLGGYVKMAGMEEMERIEGGKAAQGVGAEIVSDAGLVREEPRRAGPREFEAKSVPARALVLSAGVGMNMLFALVVFSAIALVWGVRNIPEARVGGVAEELLPPGTEALAGVPRGAQVLTVAGEQVADWRAFETRLHAAPPGPVTIVFANAPSLTIELPASEQARGELLAALDPDVQQDPRIGLVAGNSPAERAGLAAGDRVRAVNGQPIESWQALVARIETQPAKPVTLRVERSGRMFDMMVTPEEKRLADRAYGRIGVAPAVSVMAAIPRHRPGVFGSFASGTRQTWDVVALTVGFLADLFSGDQSPRNLGGPILIGQLSGRVARAGLETFLNFMALFSVNLAILNLLPIPVLDGGHLLFLGVEAVRGRALSFEQRMRLSQVGLVIVVAIMVWAIANDVLRLLGL